MATSIKSAFLENIATYLEPALIGTAALASEGVAGAAFLSPPRVARKAVPKARPKVPRARYSFLMARPRTTLYIESVEVRKGSLYGFRGIRNSLRHGDWQGNVEERWLHFFVTLSATGSFRFGDQCVNDFPFLSTTPWAPICTPAEALVVMHRDVLDTLP